MDTARLNRPRPNDEVLADHPSATLPADPDLYLVHRPCEQLCFEMSILCWIASLHAGHRPNGLLTFP